MTALVTGGAGFIGQHLVRELVARGEQVRVFDNLRRSSFEPLREMPVECVDGDVRDLDAVVRAVSGCETVFHLAAQSNVMGSEEHRDYTYETNVSGTWNVVRAAEREGVQRVVFASSREVYGDAERLPVNEDAPLRPKNLYGASKVAGEALVRVGGAPSAILRLTNVVGPGDSGRVVPLWLKAIRTRQPLVLYGGSQVLDFVPVGLAVEAFLRAAAGPALDIPVNVASGRAVVLSDLAQLLVERFQSFSDILLCAPRGPEVAAFVADPGRLETYLGIKPPADVFAELDEQW